MGSLIAPEEKPSTPTTCVIDGYDTKHCLPGCRQKLYNEGNDALHATALRRSPMWTNAVLLRCALLHGSDHPLLAVPEVLQYTIEMLVHYTVYERLAQAMRLSMPWTVKYFNAYDYYDVRPPDTCVYASDATTFSSVCSNGKRFNIANYFWYDDVYDSVRCPCPLAKQRCIDGLRAHTYTNNTLVDIPDAAHWFRDGPLRRIDALSAEEEEAAYVQMMTTHNSARVGH
jgi:hypothetical protein